jgi:hypothetical protein
MHCCVQSVALRKPSLLSEIFLDNCSTLLHPVILKRYKTNENTEELIKISKRNSKQKPNDNDDTETLSAK